VAGGGEAQAGLILALAPGQDWSAAAGHYRTLLYVHGAERLNAAGATVRHGIDPEAVRLVVAEGGALPLTTLLRCRVRYFTDGVVLGSRTFVEEAFQRHRAFFSPKRATGARKLKHADGLYAARRLRLDLLGLPA